MLTLIGVIVGFVMGLTGAGGALVAIPLFMQLQNMSLKEASIYSLIAVVIASLSNFYYQRKHASFLLASQLIISSGLGSFLSGAYKNILPDFGIAFALALIALYSLYSVWMPSKKKQHEGPEKKGIIKTIVIGILLGVLTTFTGLGGGVLMLPILLGMYKFEQRQAVATSLVVVGFSSLISFILQAFKGITLTIDGKFLGLVFGIMFTSYVLKLVTSKIPSNLSDILRKIVFTIVVVLSLAKIF